MAAPTIVPPADPVSAESDLDRLVGLFEHRVRFFARRVERRFGLDPQWRDDLVSAGYWGLLKALRNRRPDAHPHELSAYVSMRVEGAVIDEARSVLGRVAQRAECDPELLDGDGVLEGVSLEWEIDRPDEDPEDLADRQSRWQRIERSIDHLDRDHRDLLLAYAEGRSIAEIARGTGCSPGRLQGELARISRAIRARSPELRRLLRHEI
ncbi:MAG: sigma-70 family RNA polymerase sigma factor [Spirochaetaceae bacterium]|nr:sigma-70 family RNA polymerase sigma factor [Myxococcales bacterium]MCB9724965.1 sigma-70 family RNA polymerase sigma factor [Spirochaetaceae bacterium]HPG25525.1 sigma-70 family RNA polymerase sigma factor [Myxococcota bacterium]